MFSEGEPRQSIRSRSKTMQSFAFKVCLGRAFGRGLRWERKWNWHPERGHFAESWCLDHGNGSPVANCHCC